MYHPPLKDFVKFINKHLHLLYMNDEVKKEFTSGLMVSFWIYYLNASQGHSGFLNDASIIFIDKTDPKDPNEREHYWWRIKTIPPQGGT